VCQLWSKMISNWDQGKLSKEGQKGTCPKEEGGGAQKLGPHAKEVKVGGGGLPDLKHHCAAALLRIVELPPTDLSLARTDLEEYLAT